MSCWGVTGGMTSRERTQRSVMNFAVIYTHVFECFSIPFLAT